MNIKTVPKYEDINLCPICQEQFKPQEMIVMVQHKVPHIDGVQGRQYEVRRECRRKQHIFHSTCFHQYLDHTEIPQCPLDRMSIHQLLESPYHQMIVLNLLCFDRNYYELLDHYPHVTLSIVDPMNLNYRDQNGKTLLYCACQRGLVKIARKIVKMGGHPALADDQGFTPLMAAITHNHIELVRYLLTLPIIQKTINYCDHKGKMALDYTTNNDSMIKELLKVKGLDPEKLQKMLFGSRADVNKMICKYLKIPWTTKPTFMIDFVHAKILPPTEIHSTTSSPIELDETIFQCVYHPLDPQGKSLPFTHLSEQEIEQLSTFEDRASELIYLPPK